MTSSSCVNPSITYMALTARAANYAINELKKEIYYKMKRRELLKNTSLWVSVTTFNPISSCFKIL